MRHGKEARLQGTGWERERHKKVRKKGIDNFDRSSSKWINMTLVTLSFLTEYVNIWWRPRMGRLGSSLFVFQMCLLTAPLVRTHLLSALNSPLKWFFSYFFYSCLVLLCPYGLFCLFCLFCLFFFLLSLLSPSQELLSSEAKIILWAASPNQVHLSLTFVHYVFYFSIFCVLHVCLLSLTQVFLSEQQGEDDFVSRVLRVSQGNPAHVLRRILCWRGDEIGRWHGEEKW